MGIPVPSSSYVGCAFAVAGNVCIAFALNTQKLAHQKLSQGSHTQDHGDQHQNGKHAAGRDGPDDERTGLLDNAATKRKGERRRKGDPSVASASSSHTRVNATPSSSQATLSDSTTPRIYAVSQPTPKSPPVITGEIQHSRAVHEVIRELAEDGSQVVSERNGKVQRGWLKLQDGENGHGATKRNKQGYGSAKGRSSDEPRNGAIPEKDEPEKPYLKSKLWWSGLLLMTVGELGNFTSYAFAPASVVAPLGTTALIANCFIAPLMLKERFKTKDLLGIALSVLGAVIVVLCGRSENRAMPPRELKAAISRLAFVIYSSISLGFIIILAILSRSSYGDRYLFIDLLLCALCGGFTVLCTKAFSSFLTLMFLDCFKEWITYPVLAVLAGTAVLQVIYLNKALRRFESRVVVPTQFVSFTISAITGSAILYRDFEDVDTYQVLCFLFGCGLVFTGVAVLTSRGTTDGSSQHDDDGNGEYLQAEGEEVGHSGSETSAGNSAFSLLGGAAPPEVRITSIPPLPRSRTTSPIRLPTSSALAPQGEPSPSSRSRSVRKFPSFGTFVNNNPSSSPTQSTGFPRAHRSPSSSSYTYSPGLVGPGRVFSPGYLLIAGGSGGLNERVAYITAAPTRGGVESLLERGEQEESAEQDGEGQEQGLEHPQPNRAQSTGMIRSGTV